MSKLLKKNGLQVFNLQSNTYSQFKQIEVAKHCASFQFINRGDTPATVERMLINPDPRNVADPTQKFLGDTRSISLHKDDVYGGTITLKFVPPLGTNPLVEIVQLFYVIDENEK